MLSKHNQLAQAPTTEITGLQDLSYQAQLGSITRRGATGEQSAGVDPIYEEIASNPLIEQIPEADRQEVIKNTAELYQMAKEYVAPVITGFADQLLREAGKDQIIFAARDGLAPFKAATILKEKFDYGNSDPSQLIYAYLTRKTVWSAPEGAVRRHLHESGLHDAKDRVLLADIGMYGSFIPNVQQILPKIEPRYLISRTPSIPGYASEPSRPMSSMDHISGNPGVHFMEDTFSGPIDSPNGFLERDGRLVPNTIDSSFPPKEALKRQFALKAIEDYARSLSSMPSQPPTEATNRLDQLLGQPDRFSNLMVPHIK